MRLTLGYRDLPDAALPKIQAIFGGTTPAETQARIQAYVWKLLQDIYKERRLQRVDTANAQYATAQRAAVAAEDDTDWPVEVAP
jgi:hypothetical protein